MMEVRQILGIRMFAVQAPQYSLADLVVRRDIAKAQRKCN